MAAEPINIHQPYEYELITIRGADSLAPASASLVANTLVYEANKANEAKVRRLNMYQLLQYTADETKHSLPIAFPTPPARFCSTYDDDMQSCGHNNVAFLGKLKQNKKPKVFVSIRTILQTHYLEHKVF